MEFAAYVHPWIVFSLLSAFFHASRLAVTKHLSFSFSARVLTFYVNLASLVVTLPLILWYHNFPFHQPVYLAVLLLGGILSGFGGWALNIAIKRGEVSLVGPVLTLTPGFVVLIEWLVTDQLPDSTGLFGVTLLIAGSYVLGMESGKRNWFAPLAALVKNPGGGFTLTAALCFATASTFGRIGIQLSDPLSFAVMVAIINTVIIFAIFSLQDRAFYRQIRPGDLLQHGRSLAGLGLLFALMRVADQIALSLTLASYTMAVKRSAGVFAILLGRWYFQERQVPQKLAGAAVMLTGLLLLSLA